MKLHLEIDRPARRFALAVSWVSAFGISAFVAPQSFAEDEFPPAAKEEIDYAKHIHPILKKSCFRCHGEKKQKSEFRLDSREAILKGGEIGKAVVVGKSAESAMIEMVVGVDEDLKMPPSGRPLTDEQIGLLRAWIDQGLKWSKVEEKKVVEVKQYLTSIDVHSGPVTSVALSKDGKKVASAGGQSLLLRPGHVKVWSADAPDKAAEIEGHKSSVWAVAFSPNGEVLATGSYDSTVSLWDVASGKLRNSADSHKNWVTCLTFSPDGATLATGSEDTTVKLWDVASGNEKATLEGHKGTVRTVIFSPDGNLLATASFDKTVKLWKKEGDGFKEFATIDGFSDWVWSLAFSPNGKQLATAGADNVVKLFDVPAAGAKAAAKLELPGHRNWITSVVFSPDGKSLASSSFDRTVRVWDIAQEAAVETFRGHEGTVWSVRFTPDGDQVVTASQDGSVKYWKVPKGVKVRWF